MFRPRLRLVNFRLRGPMESWKVNQLLCCVATDLAALAGQLAGLRRRADELLGRAATGECINAGKADTLP